MLPKKVLANALLAHLVCRNNRASAQSVTLESTWMKTVWWVAVQIALWEDIKTKLDRLPVCSVGPVPFKAKAVRNFAMHVPLGITRMKLGNNTAETVPSDFNNCIHAEGIAKVVCQENM